MRMSDYTDAAAYADDTKGVKEGSINSPPLFLLPLVS
jgi:hypothetical protein